jgi:hypothetical protein
MDSQRAKEHGVYRTVEIDVPALHGKAPLTPVEAKKMNPIRVGPAAPAAEEAPKTMKQIKRMAADLKSQAAMKAFREKAEREKGEAPAIGHVSMGLRR